MKHTISSGCTTLQHRQSSRVLIWKPHDLVDDELGPSEQARRGKETLAEKLGHFREAKRDPWRFSSHAAQRLRCHC